MIKLTDIDGSALYLDPTHVEAVTLQHSNLTYIVCTNSSWYVKEAPEEVAQLIENSVTQERRVTILGKSSR